VDLGLHRENLGAGKPKALVGLAQAKQVLGAVIAGERPGERCQVGLDAFVAQRRQVRRLALSGEAEPKTSYLDS
jgi:hypothetical protein